VYGAGTVVAWKESGGFAGTYSPNAAYVVADLNLRAGVAYTVWIVWKTNRYMQTPGNIMIGAGPIGFKFSPSWLMAIDLG